MSQDGRFFAIFGRRNRRFGTPDSAIVLLGSLALVLLFVAGEGGLDRLLTGVVFIDGVFFGLTGAAAFVLRRKSETPWRMPGYPVIPLLFVLGELAIVAGTYVDAGMRRAAYIGLAWIGVALVLYLVKFRKQRSDLT